MTLVPFARLAPVRMAQEEKKNVTGDEERAQIRREQARRNMQRYRQRLREQRVRRRPTSAQELHIVIEEKPWHYFKRQGSQSTKSNKGDSHALSDVVLQRQKPTPAKVEKHPYSGPVLGLSRPIDGGLVSRDCFYSTLYDRFLPNTQTEEFPESWMMLEHFRYDGKALPVQCSTWLKLGLEAPAGLGPVCAVKESLLSMSLCIVGPGTGRNGQDFVTAGLLAYQRAVRMIQKCLDIAKGQSSLFNQGDTEVQKSKTAYLLLACLTCGMTEAFLDHYSHLNALKHLDGMAVLMQQCGPESLQDSPLLRAVFYEHRTMYFLFRALDRKSCFYDRSEWVDFSWKASEKQARSHMQTLLDVAFRLPTLMEAFDRIAMLPKNEGSFFSSDILEDLQEMLKSAYKLDDALQNWRRSRLDISLSSTFQILTTEDLPPFTPFGHSPTPTASQATRPLSASSSTSTAPMSPDRQRICYANFSLAISICTHHAVRIHLLHLIHDICHLILADYDGQWRSRRKEFLLTQQAEEAEQQAFELAKFICKSIEYFMEPERGIAGNLGILWPFDAAWMAILQQSTRIPNHYATPANTVEMGKPSGRQPADAMITTFDRETEPFSETNVNEWVEFCQRSADRFRTLGFALFRNRDKGAQESA